MLITFKTITKQVFEIDLNETDTIADVKKKVEKHNQTSENEFEVSKQKLIYNGKILEDKQTVGELNIDEKKFVVVMLTRKKPEAPATTTATQASSSTSASKSSSVDVGGGGGANSAGVVVETPFPTAAAKKVEENKPSPAAPITTTIKPDEVPEEHKNTVEAIQSMGYPRDEVIRALKASFFNADRAVEYLCTGIPAVNLDATTGNEEELGNNDSDTEMNPVEGLDFLQNSPQFQQLRELVRADPSLLPEVVRQISESNPELMAAIRANQGDFLQLLNSEISSTPTSGGGGGQQRSGIIEGIGSIPTQQQAVGGGTPASAAADGRVVISITEADRDAIQRLKALGFSEDLVVEAYFACDKNEDLAANYILSRLDEMHP